MTLLQEHLCVNDTKMPWKEVCDGHFDPKRMRIFVHDPPRVSSKSNLMATRSVASRLGNLAKICFASRVMFAICCPKIDHAILWVAECRKRLWKMCVRELICLIVYCLRETRDTERFSSGIKIQAQLTT